MKNKINQTGRSMIEMLGVLAIIGVLSVTGISGFSTAMRSHRANEIVAATSMLYMLGITANGGEGGMAMTYSDQLDGQLSGLREITYNLNGTMTVEIEDADICSQVKNKFGDKVTAGDCVTKIANVYNLTVTLGKTKVYVPYDSDCPSGYLVVYDSENGVSKCVSSSACQKICGGTCFDDDDSGFYGCCWGGGGTCSNYFDPSDFQ